MVKVSDILPSFQNGKRQELFSTLSKALFDNVKCMIRQGRMHDSVQVPLQACVAGARPFFRLQRRNGKKSGYSLSRRTCLRSVVRLGFRPNHTLG